MNDLLTKLIGPNWRTTISGIGTKLFSLLTVMAAIPYEKDSPGSWTAQLWAIVPSEWQPLLLKACAFSAFVMGVWNAFAQKDAKVSGSGTPDDPNRVPDGEGGTRTLPAKFEHTTE